MPRQRNKFNARKVVQDGHTFDSQGEHRRYCELKLMQYADIITGLEVHPKYELQPRFRRGKRTLAAITFTPDFRYWERGHRVVEDFKGMKETADFSIRKRLFMMQNPNVVFRVTRRGKPTNEWRTE